MRLETIFLFGHAICGGNILLQFFSSSAFVSNANSDKIDLDNPLIVESQANYRIFVLITILTSTYT